MLGWYQAPPPPGPTCGSGTCPSSSSKPLPTLVFPRAPLAPGRRGAVCRQIPAHPPESSFFLEAVILSLGSRDRHFSAVTCDAVAVPCSLSGSEDRTQLQGAGQVFQDAGRRRGHRAGGDGSLGPESARGVLSQMDGPLGPLLFLVIPQDRLSETSAHTSCSSLPAIPSSPLKLEWKIGLPWPNT